MEALKGHDVVIVAGGATVRLASENKDIFINEDSEFSARCLDCACLYVQSDVYFPRVCFASPWFPTLVCPVAHGFNSHVLGMHPPPLEHSPLVFPREIRAPLLTKDSINEDLLCKYLFVFLMWTRWVDRQFFHFRVLFVSLIVLLTVARAVWTMVLVIAADVNLGEAFFRRAKVSGSNPCVCTSDIPVRGGGQRSTGDPRLILGKGYSHVGLGGYGRTDPLLKKPFYPNGLVVGILTWYQSEGLGFESQCVHFGHPSAGGCQRSTGDPRLILGKGYSHVGLGGYGRTDPLLKKPFYPNGLVVGILTWYQSEGLGFESQCVHFGHPNAGGCQRSTGDPRLILGKGYRHVGLGGYGRTDPLLKKLIYPNGLVVGILTEAKPAVHKKAGTRSTALHTAAVDNAAGTVAEAVKENPLAKKTPDGDNAERVSKATGDSSAGINRKVDDAANEKENATPTAGKNIAADGMDKASPPRATECRMEVASRAGDNSGKCLNNHGNRSVEKLSKLPALTIAHEVMRLEADVLRLKELAKTQERQLAQQREMLSEMMGSA
ncbi:unnamed protein product [Closterium sp. NIES-54]